MQKLSSLILLIFSIKSFGQTLKDCSTCSTKIIKEEQVKGLSIDEIRLLTNDLFAREGYLFTNLKFQDYFADKSWYKPVKNNSDIKFNDIEKQNIKLFQAKVKNLEEQRKGIVAQLKLFKNNVLLKDNLNLQKYFSYKAEDKYDTEYLLSVMKKIDLEDINWYKNEGIHKVLVDNGFVVIEYSVKIENDKVSIYYNFMSNSEIIKDLDIYTDYHSEGEHLYNWQFEYKNNQLNFIRLAVAG
ncbi:YARHG domain-containing protein [Flavobacterium sp. N2038]|uniref:YARHG domain-containing protein n=1 Tax=Flavobacterium sp. N2038 TaxID=2986829 RepID=UPI0022250AFB|nr:YARHG domain-containing protein [Flavobacterium sp. N2038]